MCMFVCMHACVHMCHIFLPYSLIILRLKFLSSAVFRDKTFVDHKNSLLNCTAGQNI